MTVKLNCKIDGCSNPVRAKGLCKKHYQQEYDKNRRLDPAFLEKEMVRSKYYYENNKTSIKEQQKAYREEHKEEKSLADKNYRINNQESLKEYFKNYVKNRRNSDITFKLRGRVSNTIFKYMKFSQGSKDGSVWEMLPYSPEQLKEHLESQFEPWMNWNNYGKYNPQTWNDNDSSTWTWQIDHIIPQSDLLYTSMNDDSFRKCWELQNLRPLSSKQNQLDGINRVRHENKP